MDLIVACVLIWTAEVMLHYFPWSKLLGRPLPPPASYVVGLLPILLVFSGWASSEWPAARDAVIAMWMITVSAGAGVIASYVFDWIVGLVLFRKVQNGQRREPDCRGGGD